MQGRGAVLKTRPAGGWDPRNPTSHPPAGRVFSARLRRATALLCALCVSVAEFLRVLCGESSVAV